MGDAVQDLKPRPKGLLTLFVEKFLFRDMS